MNDAQWELVKNVVNGKKITPLPMGFIIDSPWLPNWFGVSILDYFTNDDIWFQANVKVIQTFPELIFLPGFWSEYGMCTEPSAFGSKCSFFQNEFPHAHECIRSVAEIDSLKLPNPKVDGLTPFVLNRLKIHQKRIEDLGHSIRFSVSRGPLNIASYLMGTTEFLMALMTDQAKIHQLLKLITEYLDHWHDLQRQTFPSIDGVLILDDIIGFIGEEQFKEFGFPYFCKLFNHDLSVRFLHNDAACLPSAPYLYEMGVNLFNMGFESSLNQLKSITDNKITILGNIPPRDVLANGSTQDINNLIKLLIQSIEKIDRVILSCGGGMPPGVSTENLRAFIAAVKEYS